MSKPTGFAAFTSTKRLEIVPTEPLLAEVTPSATEPKRRPKAVVARPVGQASRSRGKGDKVGVILRLDRTSWKRMHELAIEEGLSLNALAIKGVSRLFEEKGLEPLPLP